MCKSDYGGGGGGKNVPKFDYVICERPFIIDYVIQMLTVECAANLFTQ